jgi:hypothetical protein
MRLATLGFALACAACDQSAGPVANATEVVAPHLATFGAFDRWARRACDGQAVGRQRDALSETVFAPLRGLPDVQAAWVQMQRTPSTITLALPAEVPLPLTARWVTVRNPSLGTLHVAAAEPCPDAKSPAEVQARTCVLVSRSEQSPHEGMLAVTLAFRVLTEPKRPSR